MSQYRVDRLLGFWQLDHASLSFQKVSGARGVEERAFGADQRLVHLEILRGGRNG